MPSTSLSSVDPANPASPIHHHGGGTIQDGSPQPPQEPPTADRRAADPDSGGRHGRCHARHGVSERRTVRAPHAGRLIDWLDAQDIALPNDDAGVCVPASLLHAIIDGF